MSEEALDLTNDLINNNLILKGRENNRARIMTSNNDSRSQDNVFCGETIAAVKDSLLQLKMVHQEASASVSEITKSSSLGGECGSIANVIKREASVLGQDKMAEYFVHAYQRQEQHQLGQIAQLGQLQSLLASLLANSPNNIMAPWLSTKTALSSILHQLPAPATPVTSPGLIHSLHSLHANIQSTCISLDKLLEQYFILFISALLKSSHDKPVQSPLLLVPQIDNNQSKSALKRKAPSPLHRPSNSSTPNDYHTDNNTVTMYSNGSPDNSHLPAFLRSNNSRLFKKKKITQNGNKKSNFRGTSEAENEIDGSFLPREVKNEIILCEEYTNVRLDKEVYNTLTSKAPRSATRLIRLLMKHFFTQDTLARSSLSGEGIYKDRLKPEVIEAIKIFIKRRHPKLKNGSINLCMTDVCVQARRVNKNQRTRLPSSNELSGKAGDSVTSGGYSSTMFSALSTSNNDIDSLHIYHPMNPKSHSPQSINNSISSSGNPHIECPSPLVPLSIANHSNYSEISME